MKTEIEKNCKCGYRIKSALVGGNYKVKYQDRQLATFTHYNDAKNFINDHINHTYEEATRWNTCSDEPMKVKIVK